MLKAAEPLARRVGAVLHAQEYDRQVYVYANLSSESREQDLGPRELAQIGWSKSAIDPVALDQFGELFTATAHDHGFTLLSDYDVYTGEPGEFYEWRFTPADESDNKETFTVSDLPDTVFHVTNRSSLRQVLEQGLKPGTRMDVAGGKTSRRYAPRVYLATTRDMVMMYADHMEDNVDHFDPVILAVATSALPSNTVVYRDEEQGTPEGAKLPHSVYITRQIPSQALTLVSSRFEPLWDRDPGRVSAKKMAKLGIKEPKAGADDVRAHNGALFAYEGGQMRAFWNPQAGRWRKLR